MSVPCRLCGGASAAAFTAVDRNRRVDVTRFAYRRCLRCGTLFLADIPSDLGRWYPSDYFSLPPLAQLDALGANVAETSKLEAVRAHVRTGRLVEVGPGFGVFARRAACTGFDVLGLEMEERCCQHLREVIGVDAVRTSTPERSLATLPPSDVIALWHALEHLPDPAGLIAAAARNLAPGGVLVLGVPNPGALQFKLFRRRWAHLDAPRHLQLMPARALIARARAAGLATAALTSDDATARHWNAFGWGRSLLPPRGSYPRTWIADLTGAALAAVAAPLERAPGRGSAFTLVLRKPHG